MAWKDWDRTNKVVVSVCTVVAIAVLATFAVIVVRPKPAQPQMPPDTAGPTSAVSPTPSYQCTTASGPECTKELADKEAARAKVYADSEKVLRTYFAERAKADRAGGAQGNLPPELSKVVTEKQKKTELEWLEATKLQNLRYVGEMKLSNVRPDSNAPEWPSDALDYRVCVDSRNFNGIDVDSGDYVRSGILADAVVSIRVESKVWKVSSLRSKEVKSC
ncbi:MAG: hypothetical protein L0G99_06770 [Propionibacteriales bacterium]|nr:hypothetical protein [Propionibacteriales bacterium]